MLGSDRRIFIALAGLALIGANQAPNEPAKGKQATTERQLPPAKPPVAPTVASVQIPAENDLGCDPGEDDRKSDLCAQWKAADATHDAANYALAGLLVGIVGTFMLIGTFVEQRRTTRAQLRAYVAVDIEGIQLNGRTGEAEVGIKVINDGQTPAFKSAWAGNVVISTRDRMERDLAVTPHEATEGRRIEVTINGHQSSKGSLYNSKNFTGEEMLAAIAGDKRVYVFGFVWYTDTFDKKRKTVFCYESEPLPPPSAKKGDGPIKRDGQWSQMPFHNDST
jgi:hypothetical protein